MHEFRIWAPRAQKLQLKLDDREPLAMEGPDARGWWCRAVQDAGPNTILETSPKIAQLIREFRVVPGL